MKEQIRIPVSKVERASQFIKTGIQIGGNYIKHYARKTINPSSTKEALHNDNAEDIYNALSKLKGSALKVAQMMSMDRSMLPKAYVDKFQMSQYSAPPLSGPLVVKTFQKHFGKSPLEIYDTFNMKASNAASIGQVHEASLNGKRLAVKVQYPGVADSISSDLKMVKPFAVTLFGLNEADVDRYMEEVEAKLLEETDYELEVRRSIYISKACAHLKNVFFPTYYPELSSPRIITMEWLPGKHMKEFLETNPSQEVRDSIGQALWDFYEYQIHELRQIHADPHPGNFLMQEDGRLGIIDFGCVKEIPESFYYNYFSLINLENLKDEERTLKLFYKLEFLYDSDTEKDIAFYKDIFLYMINLLGKPFHVDTFDFGDETYFNTIYAFAEYLSSLKELKESKVARGSKDSLYVNRTYFGLYSLLNQLKARVNTHSVFKTMVIEDAI
jgi:predicted unusual protein kinase regulating ubiquinone biosynthesis (AarF/ABC1/UbiB family)